MGAIGSREGESEKTLLMFVALQHEGIMCLLVLGAPCLSLCLSDVVQKSCHKTPTLAACLSIITRLSVCNDRGATSITASATTPHEEEMWNDHSDSGDWRLEAICLLCTQGPLVVWGRMHIAASADGGEDAGKMVNSRAGKTGLQRQCAFDGCEGAAHSFRQPYLRDLTERSPSPSVVSHSLSISTRLLLGVQYPLSRFEDV